jgi:membrane protein required for colicin V production
MQGVNWYDIVVVVAVLYGVWAGIRAGLTGEIIGVVGLVLMIWLAIQLHTFVGELLRSLMGWSDVEFSNLVAFAGIAIVVWVVTFVARRKVHERMLKLTLASLVENIGGAFAGIARMLVVMAFVTVVASMMRYSWLQRNLVQESRFGSFVVEQFPSIKAAMQKNAPASAWPLSDIKRREEPKIDESESKTNR